MILSVNSTTLMIFGLISFIILSKFLFGKLVGFSMFMNLVSRLAKTGARSNNK